ncbi:hypothetical protein DFR70_103672 [Nocardia tenerifensis]|uniref:Uncharacterized protein n=1 Tax=Nocardia tenerifensis TaxID=228006 RepID=A0A318KTT3_9NOCA|nr:hypothetical protein [Nocardia tenerifensis]PXX66917.1 hypothetical protein DFR70_103672 [Nocardia tenerifensis]
MQRNQFGSLCIECNQGVAANAGFIYDPGGRNRVACDHCVYMAYGRLKGLLRSVPPSNGS